MLPRTYSEFREETELSNLIDQNASDFFFTKLETVTRLKWTVFFRQACRELVASEDTLPKQNFTNLETFDLFNHRIKPANSL